MIRKSKAGKRMLTMLLCGALTITSVVPAMASELPETEAAPSAVTEETSAVETATAETEATADENTSGGGQNRTLLRLNCPTKE